MNTELEDLKRRFPVGRRVRYIGPNLSALKEGTEYVVLRCKSPTGRVTVGRNGISIWALLPEELVLVWGPTDTIKELMQWF